jgi:hypothetical protein
MQCDSDTLFYINQHDVCALTVCNDQVQRLHGFGL